MAAACANAVIDELFEGGVLEESKAVGLHFGRQLDALAQRLGPERIVEARGIGHLQALELPGPAAPVIDRCREEGLLVIGAGERNIRLAPPLVISRDEIDQGVGILERAITGS